jgi:PII-like signaling protein
VQRGPAQKLSIHLHAGAAHEGRALHQLLVERAHARGLAGATLARAGSGWHLEIVDDAAAIAAFLPEVCALVDEGVVEVSAVEIVKAPRAAEEGHMKLEGKAQMLRIFIEAVDQWEGEPLHEALVKRLRQLDLAGVTVIRGLLGYGATGRVHRHKALRHDEPLVLVVVDTAEKIATVMPAIDHMLGGGMAVLSDVEVVLHRPAH